MGFWHTGYFEFHEPTGLDRSYEAAPPVFYCAHCPETFASVEALRQHRFEAHPVKRPALFLRGQEVGGVRFRVSSVLGIPDVATLSTTDAAVNGVTVPVAKLPRELADQSHGVVVVLLANHEAEARFELSIEVSDPAHVRGVDEAFTEMARVGRLDHRSVEAFIGSTSQFKSVPGYVDGLCEYFYGVMAKEQSAESHLPFAAYREKFNRAAHLLQEFRSPVARLIRGLVAFHFNQFDTAQRLSAGTRLGVVAGRFATWLGEPAKGREQATAAKQWSWDTYLTDFQTERFIKWTLMSSNDRRAHVQEIEDTMGGAGPEVDKPKAAMLLVDACRAGDDRAGVRRYARELRHTPGFEIWSERILAEADRG